MQKSYSIEEIAKILETTIWTIYKRIKEGSLPAYKIAGGRNMRILKEDLVFFLKQNNLSFPNEFQNKKTKILVVDDDPSILKSLIKNLNKIPLMEAVSANSGFSAGMLINSYNPDIVVLDIMLGDINGKEVLKLIKQDPKKQNIRIIAISGYIKDNEVDDILKSGFDAYIAKPFRFLELIEKIKKFIPE